MGVPSEPGALAGTAPQHAAITITSNQGFVSCRCVTSGNGTPGSPYVIGPWTITAPSAGTSGWSVKVDDSTGQISDYFDITGITSAYNDTNPADPDIWLVSIHTPTQVTSGQNAASATAANGGGTGVRLDGSSNIALDGLSYNKMTGPGVYLNGSANVTINNSKFKSLGHTRPDGDGIYAVDSSGLQIGTGPGCPNNSPCIDTTYDNGYGIDLVNTHNVVINATTASSNDTGGFLLDGPDTYQVTLENSHSTGHRPDLRHGQSPEGEHRLLLGPAEQPQPGQWRPRQLLHQRHVQHPQWHRYLIASGGNGCAPAPRSAGPRPYRPGGRSGRRPA